MRNWKKNPNFIKGMCCMLAGALVVSSVVVFGGDKMKVSAAKNTLPGIEQLREEYIANTKTYRILEIVPTVEQAEIGYYIGGQEPFSLLYDEESNAYRTWQEVLLAQEDEAARYAFMEELCQQAESVNSYYKEAGMEPFTIREYKEYEEGEQPEDATEIKFDGDVKRGYLEYAAGEWDATFTVLLDRDMSLDEINHSVTTPYYRAMNVEKAFSYEELKVFAEEYPEEDLYILRPEGHLEYMGGAREVWEETSVYLEKLLASVSVTELFCVDTEQEKVVKKEEPEVIDLEKTPEPTEGEKEKKTRFIENPLPLPKRHARKAMDYAIVPKENEMKYDVSVSDSDDYDI